MPWEGSTLKSGGEASTMTRAAEICKSDLTSEMIRDGLSETQQSHLLYHHLRSEIDQLLGIPDPDLHFPLKIELCQVFPGDLSGHCGRDVFVFSPSQFLPFGFSFFQLLLGSVTLNY